MATKVIIFSDAAGDLVDATVFDGDKAVPIEIPDGAAVFVVADLAAMRKTVPDEGVLGRENWRERHGQAMGCEQ